MDPRNPRAASVAAKAKGSRRQPAPDPRRPRVLVVDGDPEILRGVTRHLCARFNVTTAASAVQAAILLDAFPYHAVVSNHWLQGDEGLRLLERVRERHPGVRRILLAGSDSMELALHSAAGLFDHLLYQPVCPEALDRALDPLGT
jgi:DNA-binding NtrC family response regulator